MRDQRFISLRSESNCFLSSVTVGGSEALNELVKQHHIIRYAGHFDSVTCRCVLLESQTVSGTSVWFGGLVLNKCSYLKPIKNTKNSNLATPQHPMIVALVFDGQTPFNFLHRNHVFKSNSSSHSAQVMLIQAWRQLKPKFVCIILFFALGEMSIWNFFLIRRSWEREIGIANISTWERKG